ncbi:MAG: transketolase [Syntrophobacterales bacterium]
MTPPADVDQLKKIAKMMRYHILAATTQAGSGHPTSSLSATELMTGLFFGGFFRYDPDNPGHPNNDRLVFSKGHASPLFYALWVAAGKLDGERFINNYRKMGSPLEGHPTVAYPYVEAATGSLGQGLSIGVGLALNAKLDKLPYITYILLGDSEMAEGSQWEALAWETILIDGHSYPEILEAYKKAGQVADQPTMIIAKTVKGKGVSFLENKNGWHGVALKKEELERALPELGDIDKTVRGKLLPPADLHPEKPAAAPVAELNYPPDKPVPTRNAYGNALKRLYPKFPDIVSLDGEVSNSTRAEYFEEKYPERFFEMYIAEQNMAGAALGLAQRGKIPFVSTFAAFLTRAFDQIRMSQYSDTNIKFVGSHAGVSIGQDGPSQMGLEDLAMMRAILNSVVLYPCDAVSTERLVEEAAQHRGIVYIRTTRAATPILYGPEETFPIGGCKVLKRSGQDAVTVVTAGITVFEALKAYDTLKQEGTSIRVIDLYSIKPVDEATLQEAARETKAIITVEDHYAEGGLGEAVKGVLAATPTATPVYSLAVRRKPQSGKPPELLDYEGISQQAIVARIKELL